nr:hypothetical protein [Micromonospora sp. DSM 115978]
MRPLLYGYIRALPTLSLDMMERLERRMCYFADAQGYDLISVFIERHAAGRTAFDHMMHDLLVDEGLYVIVPTLEALSSRSSRSSTDLIEELHDAGALVFSLEVIDLHEDMSWP